MPTLFIKSGHKTVSTGKSKHSLFSTSNLAKYKSLIFPTEATGAEELFSQ